MNPVKKIPYYIDHRSTGSKYICPSVTPGDQDIIVLLRISNRSQLREVEEYLINKGFECGGSFNEESDNHFVSFKLERKGKIPLNLIITGEPKHFKLFVLATELAKKYNLTDKNDRIELFHAITLREDEFNITGMSPFNAPVEYDSEDDEFGF